MIDVEFGREIWRLEPEGQVFGIEACHLVVTELFREHTRVTPSISNGITNVEKSDGFMTSHISSS